MKEMYDYDGDLRTLQQIHYDQVGIDEEPLFLDNVVCVENVLTVALTGEVCSSE